MPENPSVILESSKDPAQLTEAAVTLAHSDRAEDHALLLKHLQSQEFLLRLDSEEAYRGWAKKLNVRQVLDELSRGKPRPAQATLLALTQSEVFLKSGARVDLLIAACVPIRPAPADLVKFWDKDCQPQDGFDNLTVDALVNNGSPPALGLLAAKLRDNRFDSEEKLAWMRSSILSHRNDAPLLNACLELLREGLSANLRLALAEALFDYKPQEWFSPATVVQPPPRSALTPEARAILERIGDLTLASLNPPAALAEKVKAELEALRGRRSSS